MILFNMALTVYAEMLHVRTQYNAVVNINNDSKFHTLSLVEANWDYDTTTDIHKHDRVSWG